MAKNNTKNTSDPQDEVEARVDAMMDTRAEAKTEAVDESTKAELPPLDIFAAQAGPPPLSEELLKTEKSDTPHEVEQTVEPHEIQEEPSEPVPDTLAVKPLNIDTPQSDAAIDDIVAQEADEVLAAEDAGLAAEVDATEAAEAEPQKKGHPFFWFIILLLVMLAVIAAVLVTNPNLELPFSA